MVLDTAMVTGGTDCRLCTETWTLPHLYM